MSINQISLVGVVARDPKFETIQTKSGPKAKCELTIKTEHKGRNDFSETCYITMSVWAEQADYVAHTFSEGMPIAVSGRLKYESWKDEKAGIQKGRHVIIPDQIMNFSQALEEIVEKQPVYQEPPKAGAPKPKSQYVPPRPQQKQSSSAEFDDSPF